MVIDDHGHPVPVDTHSELVSTRGRSARRGIEEGSIPAQSVNSCSGCHGSETIVVGTSDDELIVATHRCLHAGGNRHGRYAREMTWR